MEQNDSRKDLLVTTLLTAVPLWYVELGLPKTLPEFFKSGELGKIAETVAFKGDLILFSGGKKGETAEAFNALAKGMAILSAVPGGCDSFGYHWENGSATKVEKLNG